MDELAQTEYGLPGIVLMENAGSGAARIIDERYGPRGTVSIVCGTGNNGGDGLVVARHLHNAGWTIRVLVAGDLSSMTADCAANDRVIRAMKVSRLVAQDEHSLLDWCKSIPPDGAVVDALLGTGFRGDVRSPTAALIDEINKSAKRSMVSLDVPSGLDCDTGEPGGTAIRADLTITFVAMKPGFLMDSGRRHTGECQVVDIGAPHELVQRVADLA